MGPPGDFAGLPLQRRTISEAPVHLKRAAIGAFRTQMTDQEGEVILSPTMVERFQRPWESFISTSWVAGMEPVRRPD